MWIPIKDEENEWFWIDTTNTGRICKTHTEVAIDGSKPEWGKSSVSQIWKGPVYCCKE